MTTADPTIAPAPTGQTWRLDGIDAGRAVSSQGFALLAPASFAAETGVDATLVLRFDAERAAQEPRAFVESVLVDHLCAKTVLGGSDFRFGRGGAGDVALLRELGESYGFSVDEIADVHSPGAERRVSSTWVREALADGDVEKARTPPGRAERLLRR